MADRTSAPHLFHLRAERLNGFVRVVVAGELDLGNGWCLEETLVRLQEERATIIVDLAELTFMSASSLRIFVDAAKRARENDVVLAIVNCSRPARRVFELTSSAGLLDAVSVSELFDDDRDWSPVQLARSEAPTGSPIAVAR